MYDVHRIMYEYGVQKVHTTYIHVHRTNTGMCMYYIPRYDVHRCTLYSYYVVLVPAK